MAEEELEKILSINNLNERKHEIDRYFQKKIGVNLAYTVESTLSSRADEWGSSMCILSTLTGTIIGAFLTNRLVGLDYFYVGGLATGIIAGLVSGKFGQLFGYRYSMSELSNLKKEHPTIANDIVKYAKLLRF